MAELALLALAAPAGIAAGIITGILPGLHINLVAVIAASLMRESLHDPSTGAALAVFIIAMSISHVFHEFIPSVFLGFSESEAALAVLPGHRMLLAGMGRKAVMISALGGVMGVLSIAILAPVLMASVKYVFLATKNYIGAILIGIIALHFLKCKTAREAAASMLVLALSGAFGIAVFSLPGIKEPLLPMFAGLFGLSSLIGGMLNKSSFPAQAQTAEVHTEKPLKAARLLAAGLISSFFMGIFPALGPAQAAMLGTSAFRKLKPASYMFLLGIISSASMLLAIFTLYAFGKARNGSIAVMGNITEVNAEMLALLLAAAIAAASASFITTACASKALLPLMQRIPYFKLSCGITAAITILVLAFSGVIGMVVLATATAIGMIPLLTKTSRQLLMGCLMVPVIGYYV